MRRSLLVALFASTALLSSLQLTACSTAAPVSCNENQLGAQSHNRFLVGHTFYLSAAAGRSGCGGLTWTLTSAPEKNVNKLFVGTDGYTRFTPAIEGTYTFSLGDEAGTTETLQVISADAAPFHNLNYFAGQSIAMVNGEIWTADVQASSLSRLDPATLASSGQINVGSWPVAIAWQKGMSHAIVAQRGSDTLGLVDLARKEIEDAIWVGDEPSNIVLSPDGKIAYVTLATENAVAMVDLISRIARSSVEWIPVSTRAQWLFPPTDRRFTSRVIVPDKPVGSLTARIPLKNSATLRSSIRSLSR